MSHWHDYNRFSAELVYVPLEELAPCCSGGTVSLPNGHVVAYDTAFVLSEWHAAGDRLDGYILPRENGFLSVGIRYGSGDHEYLSPGIKDQALADDLFAQYSAGASNTPSP